MQSINLKMKISYNIKRTLALAYWLIIFVKYKHFESQDDISIFLKLLEINRSHPLHTLVINILAIIEKI